MKVITFETGVWGFSWDETFSDSATQGTAECSNGDGVRLIIPFGSVLESAEAIGGARPRSADYLFGFTADGKYIVLSNCDDAGTSFHLPGLERQTIKAENLLLSSERFNPDSMITSFVIELDGLLEWIGRYPVKKMLEFDKNHVIDYTAISLSRSDLEEIFLFENETFTVSVEYVVAQENPDTSFIGFQSKALLKVECKEQVPFQKMVSFGGELQSFVSFCMGWFSQILSWRFTDAEGCQVSYYAPFLENEKKLSSQIRLQMPLPFSKRSEEVKTCLSSWLSASDNLNTAKRVLVSLATQPQHYYSDLQFMAAAQILEALAREGRDTREMDDEEYMRRLEIIASSTEDPEIGTWAKGKLEHANFLGQRRLIKDLYDSVSTYSSRVFPKKNAFVAKHIDMRNDVTHRNPASAELDTSALYYHTQGVILLCYAALMRKLGLEDKVVDELLCESSFRWFLRNKAFELY